MKLRLFLLSLVLNCHACGQNPQNGSSDPSEASSIETNTASGRYVKNDHEVRFYSGTYNGQADVWKCGLERSDIIMNFEDKRITHRLGAQQPVSLRHNQKTLIMGAYVRLPDGQGRSRAAAKRPVVRSR